MKKITFTNVTNFDIEEPIPAILEIPNWYKESKSYHNNRKYPIGDNSSTNATVKKCVPVFDAMTNGYLIKLPSDLMITKRDNITYYNWKDYPLVEIQAFRQTEKMPNTLNKEDVAKIINPWSISTPFGYSCLFLPPMHRDNIIQIFPAIVDTDSYNIPVNLPFRISDSNFTGIIPAGTPIAQIIPFKRESWKKVISHELSKILKQESKLRLVFYNSYRNSNWSRKEYK